MEKYLKQPQIPQRTPEWYAKRARILTSTQIASVLHLNSYRSYGELLRRQPDITPHPTPILTRRNAHEIDPITWGTVLEPVAIQHLESTTKKPVGELGLKIHDKIPYLGASPDGIQMVDGKPRLIEIKCPKKRQITYRVPLEYWVQVQIAMEVWDIDTSLYCEYKFDITTEQPTTKDLTITYGTLARGVYWVYGDSWMYTIHRNREWFNRIKPQLNDFYKLKFQPIFKEKKSISKPNSNSTSSKLKRKRKHEEFIDEEESIDDQSISQQAKKQITSGKFLIKERIPISRFANHLQQDHIIDWLEYNKDRHDFIKEKSLFLDFFNQMNLAFKLNKINSFIKLAIQKSITYSVLNPSIHNLLDIYENNLLLKLPYDLNVLEETARAMDDNVGIIFMGQLSTNIDDHYIWDTYDLIINRSIFPKLLPQYYKQLSKDLPPASQLPYIPIKLKFTTLDFKKNSNFLRAKHKLDMIKSGAITTTILMDRKNQMGIIQNHGDLSTFREGLNWLKNVQNVELDQLYPNMKNKYDSQWYGAKSEIAKEIEELTQISYLNVDTRNELHKMGIKKISQLTPDIVNNLKNSNRIMPHIVNKLYLPPIINIEDQDPPCEIFLDFENCTSLGGDAAIIFMMGILIREGKEDPKYYPFLVETFDKEGEINMLKRGMDFIEKTIKKYKRSYKSKFPVYHWSQAEPTLLKKAESKLPSKCEWFDLYAHFVKNGATLPNCWTYGLKDVAKTLHKLGKIQSSWLHGLDGNDAMVMAWNIKHKCDITGEKFYQDTRIKKLCEYNYVDCQVLLEIRDLLKSHVN
tara:strand:- start:1512 stop:3920 length:2409 start_codon:yes stop_codon:yes gene_type:complete